MARSLPCFSCYVADDETDEYDSSPDLDSENISG